MLFFELLSSNKGSVSFSLMALAPKEVSKQLNGNGDKGRLPFIFIALMTYIPSPADV